MRNKNEIETSKNDAMKTGHEFKNQRTITKFTIYNYNDEEINK